MNITILDSHSSVQRFKRHSDWTSHLITSLPFTDQSLLGLPDHPGIPRESRRWWFPTCGERGTAEERPKPTNASSGSCELHAGCFCWFLAYAEVFFLRYVEVLLPQNTWIVIPLLWWLKCILPTFKATYPTQRPHDVNARPLLSAARKRSATTSDQA